MNKPLDYIFLVLALLAVASGIMFLASPTTLPTLQPIALVALLVCVIYFFLRPVANRAATAPISPNNISSQNDEDGERAYRYMAAHYGIGYDRLEVSCLLQNDGSAIIRRELTVKAYSRIDGLETSLQIPETSKPRSWDESSHVRVESLTGNYVVSLGPVTRREKIQFAQIRFAPELNPGRNLTFTLTEELFPGIFATGLSSTDVEKLNEKDYFGWNIDRPTRTLHLEVYFPEKIKPQVFGTLVQYNIAFSDTKTARYQYEEQKRLREPALGQSKDGKWVLALDIYYPMVGLMYILYWLPVPKEDKAANA